MGRFAVRTGRSVVHCGTAADAAEVALLLEPQRAAALPPSQPYLADDIIGGLMAAHARAVAALGAPTIARGLAIHRKRLPSTVCRDVRALDAAAALLRHPPKSREAVDRLLVALGARAGDTTGTTSAAEASPSEDDLSAAADPVAGVGRRLGDIGAAAASACTGAAPAAATAELFDIFDTHCRDAGVQADTIGGVGDGQGGPGATAHSPSQTDAVIFDCNLVSPLGQWAFAAVLAGELWQIAFPAAGAEESVVLVGAGVPRAEELCEGASEGETAAAATARGGDVAAGGAFAAAAAADAADPVDTASGPCGGGRSAQGHGNGDAAGGAWRTSATGPLLAARSLATSRGADAIKTAADVAVYTREHRFGAHSIVHASAHDLGVGSPRVCNIDADHELCHEARIDDCSAARGVGVGSPSACDTGDAHVLCLDDHAGIHDAARSSTLSQEAPVAITSTGAQPVERMATGRGHAPARAGASVTAVDRLEHDGPQVYVTFCAPATLPEDRMVDFVYKHMDVTARVPDEAVSGQLIYVRIPLDEDDDAERADELTAEDRRHLAEDMIEEVMGRVEDAVALFDRLPPPRSDRRRAALRHIQCEIERAFASARDLWPQLDGAQRDVAQHAYELVQGRLPTLSRLERRAALATAEYVIPRILWRRWN